MSITFSTIETPQDAIDFLQGEITTILKDPSYAESDEMFSLLHDDSPKSIGHAVRVQIADYEFGRDVNEMYLCLVYLVLSEYDTQACVMQRPERFNEIITDIQVGL